MTKFEVKDRSIISKKKIDQAIEKVESDEHLARGEFSKRLNRELKNSPRGTRNAVSKAMESANSTITSWECFTPKNFEKLAKLCKALDLDANYLLGLREEKKTLSEALEEIKDHCEHCGTNEFLCGEGGPGCTSARANQ